ncbi:MAG: outer membrane beta-barrel domain-containing protein, partial [Myxococcaceae bacterium]|nr:outer membrane beta-barrel domain-containing protein [Myxococcaceae bacterium]
MRSLLTAALLLAPLARATPLTPALEDLRTAVVAQATPTPSADEEEDEDAESPAARDTGEAEGAPIQQTALPPPGQAPTLAPQADAPSIKARPRGELVSGAPLFNPDVAVHVVERKAFADVGRHEFTLYPFVAQLNGKFTQHFGSALAYTYHLQENFGLQLTPQWHWTSAESGFNEELVKKTQQTAQTASSLLLEWGINAGFEVTPLYGKFAFNEDALLQFSLVLNAGAGFGSTRHQLVPYSRNQEGIETEATFGQTGVRFTGSVGGGFRVQMGDRLAVRLEVRDFVYTARVDRVNG